jgi:hypothetical protein
MSLAKAPDLDIERFANGQYKQHGRHATDSNQRAFIPVLSQLVPGGADLRGSERLKGAASLWLYGHLNGREFVRTVARSCQHRKRCFETCNPSRLIELNPKHPVPPPLGAPSGPGHPHGRRHRLHGRLQHRHQLQLQHHHLFRN